MARRKTPMQEPANMPREVTCQDSAMKHVSIVFQFHIICEAAALALWFLLCALEAGWGVSGTYGDEAAAVAAVVHPAVVHAAHV